MNDLDFKNTTSNLQGKVNHLEAKVNDLEKKLNLHRHYGYDKTQKIDGSLKLKAKSMLAIGTSIYANQNINETTKSESNRLVLLAGQSDTLEAGYGTENTEVILENQPENFTWKGNWVISTAYVVGDSVRSQGYSWRCYSVYTSAAATEPYSGGDYATKWQLLNFYSFFYGLRPPLFSGPPAGSTITVTSGASTITDTNQNFGINYLADSYISVEGSTLGLETYKITSNTATAITVDGTWGATDSDVVYVVFRPIYFGSANYPWKRIYLTDDIRFGKGASGGSDVIYVKYGSGTPESADRKSVV